MNGVKGITSIGLVLDGNRRWAKQRNLPTVAGHRAGREKLIEIIRWTKAAGVPYLTVYGFSTENWKRSEKEVGYLLSLLRSSFTDYFERFLEEGVRICIIGEIRRLPKDLQEAVRDVEMRTKHFTDMTLVLAISYGGRSEIVSTVNRLLREGVKSVDEQRFSEALYTRDIPDPDLVIRTGGEKRLSNFLPWQIIYSELFFVETLWPDFSKGEFENILSEFGKRKRRMGC